MKKLLLGLSLLLVLFGCSSNEANRDSKQLTIYSNSASDGRGEWLAERAKEEGFEVDIVAIPGSDLSNRLIAEKNNPIADVVFGLNNIEYEKIKNEGLLVPYRPAWADEVDSGLGDNEHYYPIVVQPLVFIYNKEALEGSIPKDITDLTKPEFNDKYNLFANDGGTGKTILSGLLNRYIDENGELGISNEGWEMAKKYVQNGHFEIKGEDYVGNVISGERPISMLWGSGVIQNQTERGVKFDIMESKVGVPFVVEQVAILNEEKKDIAKDFIDWFGSADIQSEWSAKFGSIPAHPQAMEKANEDVIEFMGKVEAQDINWDLVAKNVDKWVEKVELEYMK